MTAKRSHLPNQPDLTRFPSASGPITSDSWSPDIYTADSTSLMSRLALTVAVLVLGLIGFELFSQFRNYTHLSEQHVADLARMKLWSLGWLGLSVFAIYLLRKHPIAPLAAVFAVSAYFVLQYGLLFRGTEFGMNGHWGDNGNRLAEICKMMAYGSFFQDWYLKDLPSFYPPGWFALMAVYAKAMNIEAYQTVKWGYFLIFMVYPWLLYWSWRKIISPAMSAAVVVVTLFLAYRYMNWGYCESITAGLFIPWWLHYVERVTDEFSSKQFMHWHQYLIGALIGGTLFMIYYYWFFVALVATPFILIGKYASTRSLGAVWREVRHKCLIAAGVAVVSAVYWAPLFRVIRRYGPESAQHLWFDLGHMDLTHQWPDVSLEPALIIVGVATAFVLWRRYGAIKLLYFMLGGLCVILIDRILNVEGRTLQSRKVIEFAHLFAMIPLALGLAPLWQHLQQKPALRRGLVGVGIVVALVFANAHTEVYPDRYYQLAVNQRVPRADLAAFDAANTHGTVFLTDHYLESVYRPYYLFIPLYNMTAHTAGRYSQRVQFLETAANISEPDLFAYALAYNRYSPVEYIYLPTDSASGLARISLNQEGFNQRGKSLIIEFASKYFSAPGVFTKRHDRGIYEITAAPRSAEIDERLRAACPDIMWHLQPR